MKKQIIKERILNNGVRIITCPADKEEFTLAVYINTGLRYKNNKTELAHLAEHLVTKGNGKIDADRTRDFFITNKIIKSDAGTDHSNINFTLLTKEPKNSSELVDFLYHVVINEEYKEKEFENEKSVILQELATWSDMGKDHLYHIFVSKLFGFDYDIKERLKLVNKLTIEDIKEYKRQDFQPDRVFVFASGSFDETKFNEDIKKTFGRLKLACSKRDKTFIFDKSHKEIYLPSIKFGHILNYFYLGFCIDYRDFLGLMFLSRVLDNSSWTGRLFYELREKRGNGYSLETSVERFYNGLGFLEIYSGVYDFSQACDIIFPMLKRLKSKDIPEEEFEFVKETVEYELTNELGDSFSRIEFLYNSIASGLIRLPYDLSQFSAKSLSPADIRSLANKYLNRNYTLVAITNPFTENKPIREFVQHL